jgi:hypothetical protein
MMGYASLLSMWVPNGEREKGENGKGTGGKGISEKRGKKGKVIWEQGYEMMGLE